MYYVSKARFVKAYVVPIIYANHTRYSKACRVGYSPLMDGGISAAKAKVRVLTHPYRLFGPHLLLRLPW